MGTIGSAVVIGLLAAAFTPLMNVAGRVLEVPSVVQKADAIVVLAAGTAQDGSLNYRSMRRMLLGLRLFKRGLAPLIVLTGPPDDSAPPEAAVRAAIARDLGLPAAAIIEIPDVKTTREESEQIASVLLSRNLHQILLVTDSLHMWRSKLVFERAGLRVFPVASDDFPRVALTAKSRLELMQDVLLESGGLLYYHLAGYM